MKPEDETTQVVKDSDLPDDKGITLATVIARLISAVIEVKPLIQELADEQSQRGRCAVLALDVIDRAIITAKAKGFSL